jgi:hypothetical protein
VRDERDQPDQRQRKKRDADKLADTARQRGLSQLLWSEAATGVLAATGPQPRSRGRENGAAAG